MHSRLAAFLVALTKKMNMAHPWKTMTSKSKAKPKNSTNTFRSSWTTTSSVRVVDAWTLRAIARAAIGTTTVLLGRDAVGLDPMELRCEAFEEAESFSEPKSAPR